MGQITKATGLSLFVDTDVYRFGEVGAKDVIEYNFPFHGKKENIQYIEKGCFDEDTEVLTSEGWKYWEEVTGKELFLSTDPETGKIEWVKALQKVAYKYEGDMDSFSSRNFDLLTTPDHSHYVLRHQNSLKRELVSGDNLGTTDQCFINIAHGLWEGSELEFKEMPMGIKIPFDEYVELMGWYLSEGSCFVKKDRPNLCVFDIRQFDVTQNKEIRKVVEGVFSKKTYGGEDDRVSLYLPKELGEFFMEFGKTHSKFIPNDIKNSSRESICRFLATYIKGDGVSPKEGGLAKSLIYTASKRMANDLAELAIKAGFRPSITTREPRLSEHHNGTYLSSMQYIVRLGVQEKCKLSNQAFEKVPYNGMVYDVTLEKYHTLYVKRGGKVTISGNCGCTSAYWDDENNSIRGTLDMERAGPAQGYAEGDTAVNKYVFVWMNDGQPRFTADDKKQKQQNPKKTWIRLQLTGSVVVS